MNLEGIIAISGKGGLFKLLSQSRGGFIVESLVDGKRFPIQASNNVSSLEDIAMYTYSEEVPLKDVFKNLATKENAGPSLSHKDDANKLKNYFSEILPDYDQDRVYISDIKKVFQWYNILQNAGLVNLNSEEEKAQEEQE